MSGWPMKSLAMPNRRGLACQSDHWLVENQSAECLWSKWNKVKRNISPCWSQYKLSSSNLTSLILGGWKVTSCVLFPPLPQERAGLVAADPRVPASSRYRLLDIASAHHSIWMSLLHWDVVRETFLLVFKVKVNKQTEVTAMISTIKQKQ